MLRMVIIYLSKISSSPDNPSINSGQHNRARVMLKRMCGLECYRSQHYCHCGMREKMKDMHLANGCGCKGSSKHCISRRCDILKSFRILCKCHFCRREDKDDVYKPPRWQSCGDIRIDPFI